MSTATARATASRTPARVAPARPAPERSRPDLRVLPAQPFRAPRGPFVLAVGAVLTLGLLGVLLLNTVVAQDAFAVSALQQKSAALADQEQALTQQVAVAESPQRLESRARALGMVPSENPVFLRLADGKVLGRPVAGKPVRRAAAPAAVTPATGTSNRADATPTPRATGAPGTSGGAATSGTTPAALKTKAAALKTKAAALKTKAAKAGR